MALDAYYQAIPEDSEMFRRAQQDRLYAEDLTTLRIYIRMSLHGAIPEFLLQRVDRITELVALAKEIVAAHPGIEDRHLSWGRHWDIVHYILSAARRENRAPFSRHEHIIHNAIFGSTMLPLNAQSEILFVSAKDVAEAANYLAQIDLESLRPVVDMAVMREAKIYKLSWQSNDETFEILKQDVVTLRDFYILVSQHNEAVVTFLG